MKVHWYKPLYMGERARKKRFALIQGLRHGKPRAGTHVITPAEGGNNILDIYPADQMEKPCYAGRDFYILGVGADYDDALELAGRIVSELYRKTGGFDLTAYLADRKQ